MRRIVASMLACAAVVTMANGAVAGERQGAFSVSPFVGGYTFDGEQHLETAPVFGLRLGYDLTKNWGVEAVADFLATEGTRNDRSVNALSYRLDILYNFLPDGPLVPYLAVGGGGITYGHGHDGLKISDRTTDATINAGGGIKYFLTDSVALRADARQLFLLESPDSPKYNWEYTAGLTFLFGGQAAPAPVAAPAPAPAKVVAPPPAPAPVPKPAPVVAPAPAPVPPAPSAALSITPNSITRGETATLAWSSKNATNCTIQPEVGAVQPQGSVTITPADNAAYTLTCNGAGGSAESAARVAVAAPAPVVAAPAAPVPAPAPKLCSPAVINIQFDTNKADLKPQFRNELKALADFLKEFPNAKGVIEGHTDNVGPKALNMKLSQRRADTIRDYLVKEFGIAPDRIKAVGYGPTRPVASNKTKAGKAQNRRIESNFTCNDK
ncbi:OmpA family protein [Geomonas propionica]|uniref:OmpA family protein n=1 Tax=Geomonas propionica TaxID=2798582 RepID=A0ABS0YU42_9BACT|nr:OmpA family protein [Geomonas propionica]MBJ6801453.1 OmpA family protein [Geomonas propionica]